jgi:hypothetical protein
MQFLRNNACRESRDRENSHSKFREIAETVALGANAGDVCSVLFYY